VAVEAAFLALTGDAMGDGACNGFRFTVGEDACLGEGHAVVQHDRGGIADGEDVGGGGFEGFAVDGDPAGVVDDGGAVEGGWGLVRRDCREQIEGPAGAIGESELLRIRVDGLERHLGAVLDIAFGEEGGDLCADGGAGDGQGGGLGRGKCDLGSVADAAFAEDGIDEHGGFVGGGGAFVGERRHGDGDGAAIEVLELVAERLVAFGGIEVVTGFGEAGDAI
jgi:hypothetical protein